MSVTARAVYGKKNRRDRFPVPPEIVSGRLFLLLFGGAFLQLVDLGLETALHEPAAGPDEFVRVFQRGIEVSERDVRTQQPVVDVGARIVVPLKSVMPDAGLEQRFENPDRFFVILLLEGAEAEQILIFLLLSVDLPDIILDLRRFRPFRREFRIFLSLRRALADRVEIPDGE